MNMNGRIFASLLALLTAFGAVDSYAQFGSRGGMGGGMRGGRGDQGSSREGRIERPVQQESSSYEMTDYRLSLLEEDLHLQSNQRASWDSFAEKVRAYAGDLARERAGAMSSSSRGVTTGGGVLYIQQAADSARNRATALEDITIAAKALYANLTSDQKMLTDVRIVTIIAPQSPAVSGPGSGSNLPDLGSGSRIQR